MTKEDFLKESDISILDYYVSDTLDNNGKTSIDAFLRLAKRTQEIMLSKEQLLHLLSEIEKAEVNGIDYYNE